MSLRDDVAAAKVTTGPKCGVSKVLAALDEPFRTEVREAIEDPTLEATSLARALRVHDVDLSDYKINRHRNRRCKCR